MGLSSKSLKRSMTKNSLVLLTGALEVSRVKQEVWFGHNTKGQAAVGVKSGSMLGVLTLGCQQAFQGAADLISMEVYLRHPSCMLQLRISFGLTLS